jgi:hypothetical protein
MVTQRRYSVTGQTPPDDAEAMKARSPKLQPLDTSVQTPPCGYCDGAPELSTNSEGSAAGQRRGRNMSQKGTIVRTSSKRSATQLPSPSSPTHQLPPKIPRYRLNVDIDIGSDTDTDSDDTDLLGDGSDHDYCHGFESQATSFPSTPEHSQQYGVCSLPDATRLEGLQLYAEERPDDDEHMDDYALSPSHSRNHSLDRIQLDGSNEVQKDWAAHIASNVTTPAPPTFITLPPEIRHQIYRNCENLVIDKPLVYCISTFDGQMQHALASVSRLIRSEALAIFYSYNLWVIKVEFKMMYEAFQDWIIRLGDGAGLLRLVSFSVRGSLFKPKRTHAQNLLMHGHLVQLAPGVIGPAVSSFYCPQDGDASFKIDLSEKFAGGRVQLVRNDGTCEAGEQARLHLAKMVKVLWEKRQAGTLNGQDWIDMVDGFITFIGGW